MTAFNFNARDVEPDQGRAGAIPAGWYKTMVTKTELKPTNGGDGMLINVAFQVLEGAYKGSTFFNNFNVQNPNEKAVEIGRKQLSALCHAVNVLNMTDTDQLKSIPFFTKLKFTPAELNVPNDPNSGIKYEEKNEPTAYRDINDQAAIAGAAKTASTPVAGARPPVANSATIPPAAGVIPVQQQYQAPPQQYTPPPVAPQMQQPMQPQYQAPPMQPAAPPMQPQMQPPQQQAPAQFQPQAVPGQPDWANAPQPWGQPPAAQATAPAVPPTTPEQQQQYQQTQAAPPPWGAPAA